MLENIFSRVKKPLNVCFHQVFQGFYTGGFSDLLLKDGEEMLLSAGQTVKCLEATFRFWGDIKKKKG